MSGPCFLHSDSCPKPISPQASTLLSTTQIPSLSSHPWGQAFTTSYLNCCEHPLTSQPVSLPHLLPLFTTG